MIKKMIHLDSRFAMKTWDLIINVDSGRKYFGIIESTQNLRIVGWIQNYEKTRKTNGIKMYSLRKDLLAIIDDSQSFWSVRNLSRAHIWRKFCSWIELSEYEENPKKCNFKIFYRHTFIISHIIEAKVLQFHFKKIEQRVRATKINVCKQFSAICGSVRRKSITFLDRKTCWFVPKIRKTFRRNW